ncbi:E3 ubiquitin-protein ligase EL5-like [Triticum dicoccoides]|uniref:E3 ubiquitin-protein ligase EL5-like n=1 Tax=Triticum dicoccoides TaxID=85692 RepID=UPI00188DCE37|nr:E3 ubiquitin-protein ligase EL5-like [Triticum dicoccoides]
MTFPLVCYCNAVPRPIAAVFRFLHATALAFVLILCLLGLYEFPYTPEEHAALISGPRRRPNRDGALPETMKRRLPPVEFAAHLAERSRSSTSKRPGRHEDEEEDDGGDASTCRVCLERLEPTDEVRPLGNCAHAFHRGCIDRWIDVGEATCPLCRSSLLPRQRGGLLASARARFSG